LGGRDFDEDLDSPLGGLGRRRDRNIDDILFIHGLNLTIFGFSSQVEDVIEGGFVVENLGDGLGSRKVDLFEIHFGIDLLLMLGKPSESRQDFVRNSNFLRNTVIDEVFDQRSTDKSTSSKDKHSRFRHGSKYIFVQRGVFFLLSLKKVAKNNKRFRT
jgi:hypothetical protein